MRGMLGVGVWPEFVGNESNGVALEVRDGRPGEGGTKAVVRVGVWGVRTFVEVDGRPGEGGTKVVVRVCVVWRVTPFVEFGVSGGGPKVVVSVGVWGLRTFVEVGVSGARDTVDRVGV